jgi:hypothetical protein
MRVAADRRSGSSAVWALARGFYIELGKVMQRNRAFRITSQPLLLDSASLGRR